jgi:hypothetical protein
MQTYPKNYKINFLKFESKIFNTMKYTICGNIGYPTKDYPYRIYLFE